MFESQFFNKNDSKLMYKHGAVETFGFYCIGLY